jgi:hypothetical protein
MSMSGWKSYFVFSSICVAIGVFAGAWAVLAAGYPWYGFVVAGAIASVGTWCSVAMVFFGIGAYRTIREER